MVNQLRVPGAQTKNRPFPQEAGESSGVGQTSKGMCLLFPVLLRERSASSLLQNGVFCKGLVWYAGGKDRPQCAKVEGHRWLLDLDLVTELQSGLRDCNVTPQRECGVWDSHVYPAEPIGNGWCI